MSAVSMSWTRCEALYGDAVCGGVSCQDTKIVCLCVKQDIELVVVVVVVMACGGVRACVPDE